MLEKGAVNCCYVKICKQVVTFTRTRSQVSVISNQLALQVKERGKKFDTLTANSNSPCQNVHGKGLFGLNIQCHRSPRIVYTNCILGNSNM